jgi:hypothetical protein
MLRRQEAYNNRSFMSKIKEEIQQARSDFLFGDGVVNVRHLPHYLDVDDDDANADYDPDLFDIEYDYGEDPGNYGLDPDDIAKMAAEREDPQDPDFVAEEVITGKVKLPDYKPKAPAGEKEKSRLKFESKEEEKDEAKAWKNFNTAQGEQVSDGATVEYKRWVKHCQQFFGQKRNVTKDDKTSGDNKTTSGKNIPKEVEVPFPHIKGTDCTVGSRDCVKGEKLGICQHDVLRVLKGAGIQNDGEQWFERLKRERLRWHPDKFAHKMGKKHEAEAKELFQMIQALAEREKQ